MKGWQRDAACRGMYDGIFFPVDNPEDPQAPEWDQGRRICGRCPVKDACLAHGLRDEYGMFGGMAPKERERLVGRMRRRGIPVPRSVLPPRW